MVDDTAPFLIRSRQESRDIFQHQKWLEKEQEYANLFANPYRAAERGIIDAVILPEETREKLIRGFKMLEKKAEVLPQKKHGNIPL